MTAGYSHISHKFDELPETEQERLMQLFKQLDVTNDGKITAEDLAVAFKQMGIPYHPEGGIQVAYPNSLIFCFILIVCSITLILLRNNVHMVFSLCNATPLLL